MKAIADTAAELRARFLAAVAIDEGKDDARSRVRCHNWFDLFSIRDPAIFALFIEFVEGSDDA